MSNLKTIVKQTSLKQQLAEMLMLDLRYFGLDKNQQPLALTQLPKELEQFLKEYSLGDILICCRNPYDVLIATESTTSILIYGVSGFDQTNYQQQHFALNLNAALEKIASNDNVEDYNHYIPVLL